MMKNSPFKKLIMAFASSSTGLTITTPLYAFFIAFVLQDTTSTIYMLSIFYLVNIAAIPIWVRISQNIGKRSCYITAFVIISVVHPFYMLLGPGDIWWMTPVTIMTGFCAGAFNALPNSMKADVIDLDTLESGENRAASYFATWSFTTKIVNAGGAWLALNGLALTGFDPQLGAGNSEEHLMGLRLMFAVIPSAFYLLAVAFIWNYPITEEYHQQVRDELDRRDAVPEPAQ
jgi:GPH family glycoside/pentoside/hexuronide:cation symporter